MKRQRSAVYAHIKASRVQPNELCMFKYQLSTCDINCVNTRVVGVVIERLDQNAHLNTYVLCSFKDPARMRIYLTHISVVQQQVRHMCQDAFALSAPHAVLECNDQAY